MFHFHFVPVWEGFPCYTPHHCSVAFCWGKVPAWDLVLSCLATMVADACVMVACGLTPLQDVAGEFLIAACPCDPSSLFFWCLPFSFYFSVVSSCSQPTLILSGLHFLLLLHLHLLLSCCLLASLPSLTLLDTQLSSGCWYPPSEEKLPKKPSSCPSSLAIAGPGSTSSSAPQKDTPSTYSICILCVGWTVLFFFCFFLGGGGALVFGLFFFYTMGQGFWALPPFQINTNNEYCCSPSQGRREFVSSAVPLIPHSSSQASHRYLCGTRFRYSANI